MMPLRMNKVYHLPLPHVELTVIVGSILSLLTTRNCEAYGLLFPSIQTSEWKEYHKLIA